MFKTRFIAIFLCLTTVFATFAGVSFAEDNVDEETIVIENGKVVSGDSTLVDEGFIVIVDDEEKSADEASGDTAEDEAAEEEKEEMTEDAKLQYILGNLGAFFKPIPQENAVTTPSETPSAVNPSTPSESAKAADYTIASKVNHTIQQSTATPAVTGQLNIIGSATNSTYSSSIDTLPWLNALGTNASHRYLKYSGLTRVKVRVYYSTYCGITINTNQTLEMIFDTAYNNSNDGGVRGLERKLPSSTSDASDKAMATTNFNTFMFTIKNGGTLRIIGGLPNDSTRPFTIDGNGAGYNSGDSGNSTDTVTAPLFHVESGGTLELKNVRIRDNIYTGSNHGGAIRVDENGTVHLENVRFENCSAKSSDGGAIYAGKNATITMKNCTITRGSNNNSYACYALMGGGIYLSEGAKLTMENTLIEYCYSTEPESEGSGVAAGGGGIYANKTTINMTNCNIRYCYAQNGDGGGMFIDNGTVAMLGCRLDSNFIKDTVNTGTTYQYTNPSTNTTVKLCSPLKTGAAIYTQYATVDLVNTTVTNSQNGAERVARGAVYITRNSVVTLVQDDSQNHGACAGTNGAQSAAISNNKGGGGVYMYSAGTFNLNSGTISNNQMIFKNYTSGVQNNGYSNGVGVMMQVDEDGATCGTFNMYGGTIGNHTNQTSGKGGAIGTMGKGNIYIYGGTISGNTATDGGGIYAEAGSDLYIVGGTIQNNTASGHGGGVYAVGLSHFILGKDDENQKPLSGPTIKSNSATVDGGGIYVSNAGVWIHKAEISENSSQHGAGIYATPGSSTGLKVTFESGDIINNTKGSGIWLTGSQFTLDITGGNISGNTITDGGHSFGGAGICATQNVTVNISGTKDSPVTINNNRNETKAYTGTNANDINFNYDTRIHGGGIACISRGTATAAYTKPLTIKGNVTISGNSVPSNGAASESSKDGKGCGGGIFMEEGGTVIIESVIENGVTYKPTISNNTAYRGGGVYVSGAATYNTSGDVSSSYDSKLTIDGATFENNVSTENSYALSNGTTSTPRGLAGGAVCVFYKVETSIKDASFTSNRANMATGVGGGAISAVALGSITIEDCTFTNNYVGSGYNGTITGDGGAIFCRNVADVDVTNCTVNGNKAQQGGGLYVIRDDYYQLSAGANVDVDITGSTFSGNSDGGLFFQRNADADDSARTVIVDIGTTTISGNTLGNHGSHKFGGAGITCANGITLNLNSGTTISGNTNNVEPVENAGEGNDTAANGGGVAMIRKESNKAYITAGTLTVNGGVTISGNTATYGDGGGIFIEDETGTLIVQSSATESVTISDNTAGNENLKYTEDENKANTHLTGGNGGGIYAGEGSRISITGKEDAKVIIKNNHAVGGSFSFNNAGHGGGGIMLYANKHTDGTDTVFISHVEITGNTAKYERADGGGINCRSVNLNISDSIVSNNQALTTASNGGGINCQNGGYTLTVTNCVFEENAAYGFGGGVYIANPSTLVVDGSVFDGNSSRRGGGIMLYNNASSSSKKGTANIIDTNFGNNTSKVLLETGGAQEGGAISSMGYILTLEGECNIGWLEKNGVLTEAPNTAEKDGGGIWVGQDSVASEFIIAENATLNVSNNEAVRNGGGIYIQKSTSVSPFVGAVINNNTAGENGGGIYVSRDAYSTADGNALTLSCCTVSNNKATGGSGGGIYAVNTKVAVNNHGNTTYCIYSGNTAGVDGGAIKIIKNDTTPVADDLAMFCLSGTNFTNGEAGGNGGAISIENAPGYIVNSYIYNNTALGNGGGVHYVGNDVAADSILQLAMVAIGANKDETGTDINTAERGNKASALGGGLYVANCKNFVTVRGGYNYNEAVRGGGVYLLDCDKALFTDDGSEFKYAGAGVAVSGTNSYVFFGANKTNRPPDGTVGMDTTVDGNGAGVYAQSNVTFDNVIMQYNSARFDGGAICVGKNYTVTLKGVNDINNNVSYHFGGGIIVLSDGTINIEGDEAGTNKTLICQNRLVGDYGGAGVHVANNATFTMSYGEIIENGRQVGSSNQGMLENAGYGYGGGIDTTGGTVAVDNVIIADNAAGRSGGGVSLRGGEFKATNCVIKGNVANSGRGGGIYVVGSSSEATVSGYIVKNEVKGTTSGTTMDSSGNVGGVGGGVAVFDGGKFTHTSGAIYDNTAETGGADVFANGKDGTKLTILAPEAMSTGGVIINGVDIPAFVREDNNTNGMWWEDYKNDDAQYKAGLYGDPTGVAQRYADSAVSIRAFVNATEDAKSEQYQKRYVNMDDQFVSIVFEVQKYNVGTITIIAPEGEGVENQRFVFEVKGDPVKGEDFTLSISLLGGESVTITDLVPGTYTITQKTDWSWRFDYEGVVITKVNGDQGTDKTGGVVEITIKGTTRDEAHTVVYDNGKVENKWLSHNSEGVENVAKTIANVSFDMAEAKKGYVI